MPLFALLLLLAIPPLTDAQQAQLATARDDSGVWDEPALYPLLRNAMTWKQGDAAGAMVPDYNALHRDPADHRGQLFLIEGELGAVQPIRRRLAQPGEFETNLQQWAVLVSRDPDEVVVVLVPDPMPLEAAPRPGTHVRLPARFFKVWQFADRERIPTPYLLFVGKWVDVRQGSAGSPVTSTQSKPGYAVVAIAVVLLLGAAWYALRRVTRLSLKPRPLASQLRREAEQGDEENQDDAGPPLPQDPAAALDELRRRHDEQSRTTEDTEK